MTGASNADIEMLFDYYFENGCPCRFPRFRATVARDFQEIGAREWTVSELPMLLQVFDRRLTLRDVIREPYSTTGYCERCGAHVRRFGVPIFHDSFIERALIVPGPAADLGAAVHGPVPICGPVFHAGPGSVPRHERERIEQAFPKLSVHDWLVYMRELDL